MKRRLAGRMTDLARKLLPDGRVSGHEWVGHGRDGNKWGVVIYGGKIGTYQNFGAGIGGISGLGLIRDLACEGDYKAAYRWALDFLGEAALQPAPPAPKPAESKPRKASDNGKGMWLRAEPFDWQGPVGLYLQGRGIEPDKIDGKLRALRFTPACWHTDISEYLPAMLAPVIHAETREHIATHRTYLETVGGQWRKARVDKPKKILGAASGGVIPLTHGASRKPIAKAPAGDQCLMAEGIENALTAAQWFPELRALAAVSAGNLPTIRLPAAITMVMLVRDRDGMNAAVMQSRDVALGSWRAEGRECRLWVPPPGTKDANEALTYANRGG